MTEHMNPFTIFVPSLAGAAIGAYIGSYLQEKGKNLATREDIDRVVRKTEDIKAEISGDLWQRQNRWTFKRDLYIRLLENLRIAYSALGYLYDAETSGPATESETRTKWLAGHRQKLTTALDEIHRTSGVATVMLNTEAVTGLADLEAKLAKAENAESYFDFLDEELAAVKKAYELLKSAAKADLVLEPRS